MAPAGAAVALTRDLQPVLFAASHVAAVRLSSLFLLMSSVHDVEGHPLPRLPSTVPCIINFSMLPSLLLICPKKRSFMLSMVFLNISSHPTLLNTQSFVLLFFQDTLLIIASYSTTSRMSTRFLSFSVIAQDSLPYVAMEKTHALRKCSFRFMDIPLLFQMFSMLCDVFRAIANLRLNSVVLSHLLFISDPRYSNYFTTSIFCPSSRKSAPLSFLSRNIIFVFLVFSRRPFSSLALLT